MYIFKSLDKIVIEGCSYNPIKWKFVKCPYYILYKAKPSIGEDFKMSRLFRLITYGIQANKVFGTELELKISNFLNNLMNLIIVFLEKSL